MTYDADPPHPSCSHHDPPPWTSLPILSVDTETTGVLPEKDGDPFPRIVELGALWMPGGLTDTQSFRMQTFINPQVAIPESATAVHGITDEMVRDAPTLDEVADRFLSRVSDAAVLSGFNLRGFDAVVLDKLLGGMWGLAAAGKPLLDTLDVVRLPSVGRYWRGKGRHKLEAVAERLCIAWPSDGAHRASCDARVSLQVLHRFRNRLPSCPACADAWLAECHEAERERFEAWRAEVKAAEEADREAS